MDVCFWPIPDDWYDLGGTEKPLETLSPPMPDMETSFWFRMKYDPNLARFETIEDDLDEVLSQSKIGNDHAINQSINWA